jgi:drug/metabolite transporter (DMT)-like permease
MTLPEFCLILFSILASVAGQFFLKAGALKLGRLNTTNIVSHVVNIVFTPELILGLTCYGIGAIVYILLLTRVKLSVAAPSISLVYVFSVLLGYFLFKEYIPVSRAFGLGLIICGVILVAWKQ